MKLSLILMCWNTAHLMRRTLYTLERQDFDDWELIVVDDNSPDDVRAALGGYFLPVTYHRLDHPYGMRGNTASINFGLSQARGDVVVWSTPEVMLPPGALRAAYDASAQRTWVTIPSHGLSYELQLLIDTVDWQADVHNIKKLVQGKPVDHWDSVWFYLNFYENGRTDGKRKPIFGNNQTVAVNRQEWLDAVGYFPLFYDYGSDDPWVSRKRNECGYTDVTLWDYEAYHQWHPPMQYWMAQGYAPNWNKFGHTTSNLAGDPDVPENGTCGIWDGGDESQMSPEECREIIERLGEIVKKTMEAA